MPPNIKHKEAYHKYYYESKTKLIFNVNVYIKYHPTCIFIIK